MAPWLAAALISPWPILIVLILVSTSTLIVSTFAKNQFQRIGFFRTGMGYFVAVIFMIPLSAFVGSFNWRETFYAFIFLAYAACLALAIVVVPSIFILIKYRRLSIPWILTVGIASVVLFLVIGNLLRGPGIGEVNRFRLLYHFFWMGILMMLTITGFLLGANISWKLRDNSRG